MLLSPYLDLAFSAAPDRRIGIPEWYDSVRSGTVGDVIFSAGIADGDMVLRWNDRKEDGLQLDHRHIYEGADIPLFRPKLVAPDEEKRMIFVGGSKNRAYSNDVRGSPTYQFPTMCPVQIPRSKLYYSTLIFYNSLFDCSCRSQSRLMDFGLNIQYVGTIPSAPYFLRSMVTSTTSENPRDR